MVKITIRNELLSVSWLVSSYLQFLLDVEKWQEFVEQLLTSLISYRGREGREPTLTSCFTLILDVRILISY